MTNCCSVVMFTVVKLSRTHMILIKCTFPRMLNCFLEYFWLCSCSVTATVTHNISDKTSLFPSSTAPGDTSEVGYMEIFRKLT